MKTVPQNPPPQTLSEEEAAVLLDQFTALDFEEKKVFILEHRELLTFVNRSLVYDQIIGIAPKEEN